MLDVIFTEDYACHKNKDVISVNKNLASLLFKQGVVKLKEEVKKKNKK